MNKMMDTIIFLSNFIYYIHYLNIILNSKLYNQINYLLSNLINALFCHKHYQMRMSNSIITTILLYKLIIYN